jgi:GTP pyrophosphokinase/guanosine-3',5'-bis(diphosphate) 3'-pyrophosphohydrolase
MVEFEDQMERWVDLSWSAGHHAPVNAVTLDMTISNDPGVLGRICTLIAEQNANISDLRFVDRKPDFFRLYVDVDVRDREHLHAVIMAAESDSDVAQLRRHRQEGTRTRDPVPA